jgi:glutamyl-tRNA synthetase
MVDFLFLADPVIDETSWNKTMTTAIEPLLAGFADAAVGVAWQAEALKALVTELGEASGLKLGKAQAPIRVAVTGRTVGPPLFESLEVLGRDEVLRRVGSALAVVRTSPAGADPAN